MTARRPVRTVLTIAGSDSGGGAGIQADLKTFAALGVYGMSAITAITAQNTVGVTALLPLPADLVTAQIEAVASDIAVHATKIGMLANAAIVEATVAVIAELELPLVVVDPVMVAKGGASLIDVDGVRVIRTELLPRALVVTPNIPEAEALGDMTIRSTKDAREAARRIHRLGPAVIIKGGHSVGEDLVDVLFDGEAFTELHTPRIVTTNTHGTGCTYASAVAAHLALGYQLVEAATRAQTYVAGAIRHGLAVGHGHGPLDHFWNLRRPEPESSPGPGDFRTSLY
jgi:hydroxymethylpyrimidine/phosphomethylpyrimidine kinase